MPRPGPLMPLPLDQFLLPIQAVSKRPHSPGGPTPFSPAKRRLLNEEGLFKTPQPRNTDPSRFSRVLAGPGSPARVLDFAGIPRNNAGDPQKRPSTSQHPGGTVPSPTASASSSVPSSSKTLAPSPELKGKATRQSRIGREDASVNPFDFDSIPSLCKSSTPSNLTFVPRELPTQSDPRSIHYPGFTVYQDPHVVIYPPSTGGALGQEDMEEDAQMSKENIAPRRRVKKMAEPLAKTNPFSPSGTTARMSQSLHDTPRASTRTACLRSPSMTPQSAIHKGMRQLMKDELDIGEGDYY